MDIKPLNIKPTILLVILMITVLGFFVVLANSDEREVTPAISTTRVGKHVISTVEHDGHRWVMDNFGGIAHHPDCPKCNSALVAK